MRRVVVGSCLVVAALFVGGRALHSQTPAPEVILVNAKDRKSTRLNSSHTDISRMPSSA